MAILCWAAKIASAAHCQFIKNKNIYAQFFIVLTKGMPNKTVLNTEEIKNQFEQQL
jgi:hypothetical protein